MSRSHTVLLASALVVGVGSSAALSGFLLQGGKGVGPLAFNGFDGLVVSVLPAHHRYRGDALALVAARARVDLVVVRLVHPAPSLRDSQEADALLQSLVAVP